MKKAKQVKDMSIHEASQFWDEHDLSEFQDVTETRDVDFALKKKKYVAVDMNLYRKIRNKAKKLHKTEDDLINEWLRERANA